MRFVNHSLALLAFLLPSLAMAWEGKVVGIADGDTIKVMHDGHGEKIRLYGIDTPERHQDFGTKAKQFTSDKVFGKVVRVEAIDRDRYGRTVGVIHIGSTCANCPTSATLAQIASRVRDRSWATFDDVVLGQSRYSDGLPGDKLSRTYGRRIRTACTSRKIQLIHRLHWTLRP